MKTFEEKFTAWIDGRLAGRELDKFEAELAKTGNAAADGKRETLRLGSFLRENYRAPALENPDFFNHQLMHRIEADAAEPPVPAPGRFSIFRTVQGLAWAGAVSMLMAAAVYLLAVPKGPGDSVPGSADVAQIMNSKAGDPAVSVSTIHSKDNKLTVLWLDGLDYLPSETDQ